MNDPFDQALADLGVANTFDHNNTYQVTLRRDDDAEIEVMLFRDLEAHSLCVSAFGSQSLPQLISRELFLRFANAAAEPMRGNLGVGVLPGSERICIYQQLSMRSYRRGDSALALENVLEQVADWDAHLQAGSAPAGIPRGTRA